MQKLVYLGCFLLLISCGNEIIPKEHAQVEDKVDTCFWRLTDLVMESDTVPLALDHLILRIGDSTVKKWQYLNDTLSYLTSRETCRSFVLANDSILIPITCIHSFSKLSAYQLVNGYGEIKGVKIVHSLENYRKTSYKVLLKRKFVPLTLSNQLLKFFNDNPDTLLVLD